LPTRPAFTQLNTKVVIAKPAKPSGPGSAIWSIGPAAGGPSVGAARVPAGTGVARLVTFLAIAGHLSVEARTI
jgi:hypothetical protein